MSKISYIKFKDARYSQEKIFRSLKLPVTEAYGFLKKNGKNYVLSYAISDDAEPIEGLILPQNLLAKKFKFVSKLGKKNIGSSVAITWSDIVHFLHKQIDESSTMYTEGILYSIDRESIILKDPETLRLSPLPMKNHPTIKPLYYQIPKRLISDVKVFNEDEKDTNKKR